ncbi:GDP-mannose 4,6-dehydratase [Methylocapsa polymorpha]|uniref:GDP-mannose 4,6-dehydratase n=1 Tax=Methylocapsa polymorpha TaxID=3080828 RepID=A0ABZ0HQX6_9HYPH|nr:GDP-mannose 4,6-dehydratase [Methylocapsa sp. RX1]
MKTALITGVTGQDGAYLSRFLLNRGYKVYATYRRSSTPNFWRIQELGVFEHPNLHLREYDLTDLSTGLRLIEATEPDEIYNLAAQTFVHVSFDQPIATGQMTGLGPVYLLEAIRAVNPRIRFYQASSAEMFGAAQCIPQDEATPFYPRSPYGAAKLYAHWMTVNYREAYGIFAASGILFNHESPLRGPEFVTRKMSIAVSRICAGLQKTVELGNLGSIRDWGYAEEYVEGMWLMLQAAEPDTFVLATNHAETVRDYATMSFRAAGVELEWVGSGDQERGVAASNGATLVQINPRFYRPSEVEILIGNPEKARAKLGWEPKTSLDRLCSMLVKADIERVAQNKSIYLGRS